MDISIIPLSSISEINHRKPPNPKGAKKPMVTSKRIVYPTHDYMVHKILSIETSKLITKILFNKNYFKQACVCTPTTQ